MRPSLRLLTTASAVATLVGTPTLAHAQTVTAVTNQPYPERFLNYSSASPTDLGQTERPNGFNPTGINYADCIRDMTLRFSVYLSGFTGQALEVWIGQSGDCTQDGNRGNAQNANCWKVSSTVINQPQAMAYNFPVRVQDIVGPQAAPPTSGIIASQGPAACTSQPTETAVQLTVYLLPITGDNHYVGTGYQQTIQADMVGPSAPLGVSIGDGDTLMIVNWTANTDADTGGYDILIDPPPGTVAADGAVAVTTDAASNQGQLVCPDAASTSGVASDAGDAGDDSGDATAGGTADAAASSSDAGCYYPNNVNNGPGPPGSGAHCTSASSALLSGFIDNTTTSATATDAGDDASTTVVAEASATSTAGAVGISTALCQYGLPPASNQSLGCAAGQPLYESTAFTITGESGQTFTIKGLVDGVAYNVAVAAVDNFGNVGPASTPVCQMPAPIQDFFATYRGDGGRAGGGFCALVGVGLPAGGGMLAGTAAIALLGAARRRRRRGPT